MIPPVEQLFNPGARAAAEPLRLALEKFTANKCVMTAISVQIAERNLAMWRRANIKEVTE